MGWFFGIFKRRWKFLLFCLLLMEAAVIIWPDAIVLAPSRHAIDPGSAVPRMVAMGGEQLEVYVDRSPACGEEEPRAFVLEFCGSGYRAEEATSYIANNRWKDFPVEVWCLNYPGSGKTTLPAKLSAIPPAALATYDALKAVAGDRPIFIEANSLGGVPALYVASRRPTAGVIVQNPPPLKQLIMGRFGWWNLWLLATPVALQVPLEMNAPEIALQVPAGVPALFIQAMGDTYIPPAYQNRVIDAYAGVKTLLQVPAIGHNDGLPGEYEGRVQGWIREQWKQSIDD